MRRDGLGASDRPARWSIQAVDAAGKGSALQAEMSALLIPNEIRAPLPRHLRAAQKEGMEDFYARSAELAP